MHNMNGALLDSLYEVSGWAFVMA